MVLNVLVDGAECPEWVVLCPGLMVLSVLGFMVLNVLGRWCCVLVDGAECPGLKVQCPGFDGAECPG